MRASWTLCVRARVHGLVVCVCQAGRLAYRKAVSQRLVFALRAFNPDLVILSSGAFAEAVLRLCHSRNFTTRTSRKGVLKCA